MLMRFRLVKKKNPQNRSEEKLYANPVNVGTKTILDIAEKIAGRSALTRGDVYSVLSNCLDEIPSLLKDGFSVQLGELGTLRVTLSSKGAVTVEEFKATSIKGRVVFNPSPRFKDELARNHYEAERTDDDEKKEKTKPEGKKPEEGEKVTP